MDVQELKVKVLYTLAPNATAVMALTRRVPVTLIPSAEPGSLGHGKVLLRHCLLAICHSNPDLIGDAAKDYSVYALDPLEPVHAPLALPAHVSKAGSSSSASASSSASPVVGGTAVGLGLMSWCLDADDADGEDEDAPFVIGTIFAHPVMGCGLQVFLTLHEMAARSRAQHGSLMKQWSAPPKPAPAPKPTPYLASSPVLAPAVPAKRAPAPPKAAKPKKAAPSTAAPAAGAMFFPHPHHASYYAPPWGVSREMQDDVLRLQKQVAEGRLADADPVVLQQVLGALSRFMPVPLPGPASSPAPAPVHAPVPMYAPTPVFHRRPPSASASSTPGPPPYQAVAPAPPPQRKKAPAPAPAPARPTTPVQQTQTQALLATTPEPIPNVQYTLPRPPVSVMIGSREREKENAPAPVSSSSSSSLPRGTKRSAEPSPADGAPNKRPSPAIADATNTFVRPATPKARRAPPPPQSSSPLFSTARGMLRAGASDAMLVAPMTSSPPRSMLSSPTLAQKKFTDLPPSSPPPEDESSCSSAITTPGEPDEDEDDEMEEVNPIMQSDHDLCEELFGQWA